MIKKTYKEVKVGCKYYLHDGVSIEHCKDCTWFNGFDEKDGEIVGVDCLTSEIPSLSCCHVTGLKIGNKKYESRDYDKDIDGPIEGDDEYDFCQKCVFNKRLVNGSEICLLRSGFRDDVEIFSCYEGEIWKEVKDK